MRGHAKIVKFLLDAGAVTNSKDVRGHTSFDLATRYWLTSLGGEYEETVSSLLDKDPSLVASQANEYEDDSLSIAHTAATKGSVTILTRLFGHGSRATREG